jgi:hypothetical protein
MLNPGDPGIVWDLAAEPPHCIDHQLVKAPQPFDGRIQFAPRGRRFLVPGGHRDYTTAIFDRDSLAPIAELPVDIDGGRHTFSPDGRCLASLVGGFDRPQPRWETWLEGWAGQRLPWNRNDDRECHFEFRDLATGAIRGRVPAGFWPWPGDWLTPSRYDVPLGFSPDGRMFWVCRDDYDEQRRWKRTIVRCWAVPSPWPPLWLIAVTALGVLLVVAAWRRSRRRVTAVGAGTP